jgi:hypothetical protein
LTYFFTDVTGCVLSKDTLIKVSGPTVKILGGTGTPKISGDTTILYTCANTPITIRDTAYGGVKIPLKSYGHLWSTSTTTVYGLISTLTNIAPGKTIYKVLVTDNSGCSRTKFVRVESLPATFDVKINDTVVCVGDSALVTAKIVDLTGKPLNLNNFDVTFTYTGGKANVGSFPTINGNQTYVKYITWFGSASEYTVVVKPKNKTIDPCLTTVIKYFNVTQKSVTATLSSISIDTNKFQCQGTSVTVRICSNEPMDSTKLKVTNTSSCYERTRFNMEFFTEKVETTSIVTEQAKRGSYCYNVTFKINSNYPVNGSTNCYDNYVITHPCMKPIKFRIKTGSDMYTYVTGETVVCANDSTTLNAVVTSAFDVTKAKISWTDCNNKPIPLLANKTGIKVGVGCYKLTVVSPCGNTYTKVVNVSEKTSKYNIKATYDCHTQLTKLEVTNGNGFMWTDDNTRTSPRYVDPYSSIKNYKVIPHYWGGYGSTSMCGNSIDVTIPCTKPTTGIKTVQIATGWYSKSPTGTCDASTFKSYVNKADLIDKYDTRKYVNGGWIFNYCYNAEKVDFVFDTINKSFIGSQLYVSGTCKPFKDGYYVISADDYYQVIKRMSCAFAFHVSCGKVDSLFTNCINDYRGLGKVILGPNSFEQSTSNPKVVSEIKIHPNPNNGQFSVILDNAQVDSYRIDVYDLNGKLIHTQNMYDEKSGTIQTKLDLTPYSLSKGLYIIHAVTNDNTFIERVEIE